MLDLSRCRNLLEFDLGQALEECLGSALEPLERPSQMGFVGSLPGWFSCLAIHPPLDGNSPSFMLASVAHPMFVERGWTDAPLCANMVAVYVDLDDGATRADDYDVDNWEPDSPVLERVWLPFRFTAQEVRMDARGCAQHVCERFIERQQKVLDDGFMQFIRWRASCLKHPCEAVRHAQNQPPQRALASCLSGRYVARGTQAARTARSEGNDGAIAR